MSLYTKDIRFNLDFILTPVLYLLSKLDFHLVANTNRLKYIDGMDLILILN